MSAHYPSIVSHDEFIRRFQTAGDKLNVLEESQRASPSAHQQQHEQEYGRMSSIATKNLPQRPPSSEAEPAVEMQEQHQHPYAYSSARSPSISQHAPTHSRGNSLTSRAVSLSPIPEGAPRAFHYPTRAQPQQPTTYPMAQASQGHPVFTMTAGPLDLGHHAQSSVGTHQRFSTDHDRHEEMVSEKGSQYRFTFGDSDAYNRGVQHSGWIPDSRKKGGKRWILIGLLVAAVIALAVGLGVGLGTKKHDDRAVSAASATSQPKSSRSTSSSRSASVGSTPTPNDTSALLTVPTTPPAAAGTSTPAPAAAATPAPALPVGASAATSYVYAVNGFTTTADFTYTVPASVETRDNGQWQWTQPVVLPTDAQGGMTTSLVRVRVFPTAVPGYNASAKEKRGAAAKKRWTKRIAKRN